MALEVGSVSGRLGFNVDETGANRFERKLAELRGKADRPIRAEAKVDVDKRSFDDYGRRVADVDKHHSNLVRGTGRVRSSLGSLWVGGAGIAAGAVAFGALGAGVKYAFGQFQDSERVARQTNATLKSTGQVAGVSAKDVSNLATAISRKTGVDDEAIQSGENLLLTFTNIRNETGKGNDIFNQATQTVTDMSAALGQDTKSSAIQLGKALNDPIKGVTALQRVGVSFTASQKEQIKGLVEHGKTLDAQKLILRELNKEFGGSAAATATSTKRLQVTLGNLAESVGKAVAPLIERGAKALDGFVTGMMDGTGAGGRFVAVAKSIGTGVAGAGRAIRQAFAIITGSFQSGNSQASRLSSSFRATFNGIARTVRSIVNSVVEQFRTLGPELTVIARRVGQVIGVLLAIFRRLLPAIRAIWDGAARIIRGVIEVIAGILSGDFGKIAEGFKHILSGLVRAAGGIIRGLTAPFREVMARIGGVVSKGLDAVVGFVRHGIGTALGIIRGAVGGFRSAASAAASAISAPFRTAATGVDKVIDGIKWLIDHIPRIPHIHIGPLNIGDPRAGLEKMVAEFNAGQLPGGGDLGRLPAGGTYGIARRVAGMFGLRVSSGYRTPEHNAAVGGVPNSLHTHGSPSNPGAIDLVGPYEQMLRAQAWARTHLKLKELLVHDVGSGLHLHLGFFRRGGKPGNVGPGAGGPAAFIAGEGVLPEWVISQEGDRRSNIAWARDALESLTGRRVELARGGKGPSVGKATQNVTKLEHAIERAETQYDQADRRYNLTDEEFIGTDAEGNAILDEGAVEQRAGELESLLNDRVFGRRHIKALYTQLGRARRAMQRALRAAIGRLRGALKHMTGKKNAGRRSSTQAKISTYRDALSSVTEDLRDFDLKVADQGIDIEDLIGQIATVRGTAAPAAAVAAAAGEEPTAEAPATDTGGGEVAAADAGAVAPPSAEDIAAAAIAQVGAFQAARAELFGSYGANFMAAGATPGAAAYAAGARYFGGGSDYAGAGGAGAPQVTQIITFPTPPSDPHGWTAASLHEMQSAL